MSATYSDDQGNMSDYGNAATASSPGKASWDDKAVSEMYISLANIRGGFTAAEAVEVEKDMLSKGYSFTAKQLQTKHTKIKAKLAAARGTSHNDGDEVKPKPVRKPRAKAAQKTGSPIAKPKATPKPRAKAAKKEAVVDEDGLQAEAPPTKKRKAAGTKAAKKVVHETVPPVKNESEEQEKQDSDAPMMDAEQSYRVKTDFDVQAQAQAQAQAQEETNGHVNGNGVVKDGAQDIEEYNGPEGETDAGEFAEQFDGINAAKNEADQIPEEADPAASQLATETAQHDAHAVAQTSA